MPWKLAALAALLLTIAMPTANARRHQVEHQDGVVADRHGLSGDFQMRYYYIGDRTSRPSRSIKKRSHVSRAHRARHRSVRAVRAVRAVSSHSLGGETVVAHPVGCPSRSFCGCGVSLYLFGKAVREGGLAIAANWLKFPRAEPGPGRVAARRGHVFVILENRGKGKVLAYDPNSGGHRTRIHERRLAGYTVVNPKVAEAKAEEGREDE